MFESKGLAHCSVAVVKAYLSHLNPKCEALFQKPLSGAKFNPSSDVIWYSTVPLGHNTIGRMMKNMSVRAGINPPFTNHCVRSTTVNILSSRNMKNRHIRAVTGHKSDASLESYNDRPTFEQFQDIKHGSHLCDKHNTSDISISISTRKKEHVSFSLCLCLCLCRLCYAYRTSVNQA